MNSAKKRFSVEELWPLAVRASVAMAPFGVWPVLCLAVVLAAPSGHAQAPSSQQTDTGQLSNHPLKMNNGNFDPSLMSDGSDQGFQQRRIRQLNAAKYKSIVSNTDKLMKLVEELNAEISSTNPASLTPDQLRKIAAIEKFARSVKDEMRSPVQGSPAMLESAKPLDNNPNRR